MLLKTKQNSGVLIPPPNLLELSVSFLHTLPANPAGQLPWFSSGFLSPNFTWGLAFYQNDNALTYVYVHNCVHCRTYVHIYAKQVACLHPCTCTHLDYMCISLSICKCMCVCVCNLWPVVHLYPSHSVNISFETLSLPSFLLYKMTGPSQAYAYVQVSQDVSLFICDWVSLRVLWLWVCGCMGGGLHGWSQGLCVHAAGPKSMSEPCHSAGHGMLCCVVLHHRFLLWLSQSFCCLSKPEFAVCRDHHYRTLTVQLGWKLPLQMKRLLLLWVEFTDRNLSFVIPGLFLIPVSKGGLCDVTKNSQKFLLLES